MATTTWRLESRSRASSLRRRPVNREKECVYWRSSTERACEGTSETLTYFFVLSGPRWTFDWTGSISGHELPDVQRDRHRWRGPWWQISPVRQQTQRGERASQNSCLRICSHDTEGRSHLIPEVVLWSVFFTRTLKILYLCRKVTLTGSIIFPEPKLPPRSIWIPCWSFAVCYQSLKVWTAKKCPPILFLLFNCFVVSRTPGSIWSSRHHELENVYSISSRPTDDAKVFCSSANIEYTFGQMSFDALKADCWLMPTPEHVLWMVFFCSLHAFVRLKTAHAFVGWSYVFLHDLRCVLNMFRVLRVS